MATNKKLFNSALVCIMAMFLITAGALKVSAQLTKDGRWFKYNGQYKYLVGWDCQELACDTSINYNTALDAFAANGLNKVRIWVYCWFGGSSFLAPWTYSGGKYNLDSWNAAYWERVRNFVSAARARNIVVEISIFAPNDLDSSSDWSNTTYREAYNKAFNTNGVFTANSNGHFVPEFYDLTHSETSTTGHNLKYYQESLVDKTISELGSYDNVYFEVCNEFPVQVADIDNVHGWQEYMASRINDGTSRLVSVHAHEYVGAHTTGIGYFWDKSYIDILDFHFYTVEPNDISNLLHSAQLKGKVLQSNEGTSVSEYAEVDMPTRRAWGFFMSGGYFACYEDDSSNVAVHANWFNQSQRMKVLREIAESVEFWKMSPVDGSGNEYDSLVTAGPTGSNRQVLANPGSQYVIYFWGTASTTNVQIQLATGNYNYVWYDARDKDQLGTGTIVGNGGIAVISPPSTSVWSANAGLVLTVSTRSSSGNLQFSAGAYIAGENGGNVTITATRTGGSSGAVGVSYATSNGTAVSGSDYTSASGTLSWPNGDSVNKTFTVPITNDTSAESNETINLTLSNPTGGAAIGSPGSAVLTIMDDDSTGLVAHYKFDEGSGSTAADSSGNGNNATISGGLWDSGKKGSAISFAGNDPYTGPYYASAPDSASLDIVTQITMMAWIKPTGSDNYGNIVAKPNIAGDSNYYGLFRYETPSRPDRQWVAGEVWINGECKYVIGDTVIPISTWTHVACTYDGSTMKIYVNGVLDNTASASGNIDTNNMPLLIGKTLRNSTESCYYFNGALDDVRVYNRALSNAEITAVMNDQQLIDTTPPSPPAAVRDGTSATADSGSTGSTTQLAANWDVATDNESGISGYKYAIGSTPGATNVTNGWIANTATNVTKTGLTLTVGTTYYFSVKAINGASPNMESANATNSNGQVVTSIVTPYYEAEDAAVYGGIVRTAADSTFTGYSGTGYVDYTNPTGDYIEWTINVGLAGIYKLEFMYANGGTGDRPLELKVNGSVANSSLSFPITGSWSTWITVSNNVALNAGANTVRLTAVGSSGANIDYLNVASPKYEAEDAAVSGGIVRTAADSAFTGYSGTGYVDYTNPTGDYIEWTVNVGSAGAYDLEFRYANGGTGDRPLELKVNGSVASSVLSFPITGSWSTWATVSDNATLNAGANTVRLTAVGSSGANIDYLDVNAANSVDTTPPGAPAAVRDGASTVDISSTISRTQLSANWTAATDAESGISGYQYAIGLTPGGSETAGWTTLGNVTTVTKTNLSLIIGTTYYFSVKAINGAGLSGPTTNSNGQVVLSTSVPDTTAPVGPATVRDGAVAGTDASYTNSTAVLSANWTPAADSESGIANYQYAIGTTAGGTGVAGWTTIGNVTTVTRTGLSLATGTTYYFSVKAVNGQGLTGTAVNSNGQYVVEVDIADTTPPGDITVIRDGTSATADSSSTESTIELSANWDASTDLESGVEKYYYAIGTTPEGTDLVGWTDNGAFSYVTKTGLNLAADITYYFSVKAENGVGLQSGITTSNGQYVVVDIPGDVIISNIQANNITSNSVTITWQTDLSATSQVEYGLTAGYGSLIIEDTSLVTSHSVTITGLSSNQLYHYRVKSRQTGGNTAISPDCMFATPPVIQPAPNKVHPNPVDFSKGQQMTFSVGNSGGEAKIYTISGKLVRKLGVESGAGDIKWDGKNEAGQKVVRGIYIYRIKTADGSTTTGKLAVVH